MKDSDQRISTQIASTGRITFLLLLLFAFLTLVSCSRSGHRQQTLTEICEVLESRGARVTRMNRAIDVTLDGTKSAVTAQD